jgi:hypothetical protein
MLNEMEKKLIKLEKELADLRFELDMQTDRLIDEFWDQMADEAETQAVDASEKWR